MRLSDPFRDLGLGDLFETALPDFVLAFVFFTSVAYATLGKRFELQRPAVAMSAAIGLSLSAGLVWWEQSTGFSIRNLGPIAVGFALIILALVMYQSVRQVGGSWAGAGIALGASLLIAKLVQLRLPFDAGIIQMTIIVALVVGLGAFLLHRRQSNSHLRNTRSKVADIKHDMSDLKRGRHLSNRITKGLHRLRHEAKDLNEHPEQATEVLAQLKKILPAEGWLTQRMAQLRAKAHGMRNGHIAKLQETRKVFSKLPASTKKKAAAELADRYTQIIGIDTRLERLDRAVAEAERRIRELTARARQYAANYDQQKLSGTLKAAERLQQHNTRLFKTIEHTEKKLSDAVKKVADQARKVRGK
jgi:hypothetical protein